MVTTWKPGGKPALGRGDRRDYPLLMSVTEPSSSSVVTAAELGRLAWIDRDTSWLEFNRRVLQEALDDRTPLLERAKFLAIFSSNLDEFFMKRMSLIRPSADDSSPVAQERRDRQLRIREIDRRDARRAGGLLPRTSSGRGSQPRGSISSTGTSSTTRRGARSRRSSTRRSRRC